MSDNDENSMENTVIPQADEDMSAPKDTAAENTGETAKPEQPEETAPEETMPEDTAPENAVPEEVMIKESSAPPVPEQPNEKNDKEKPSKKPVKVPLFAAIIVVLAVAVLASQITFLSVRQSYHDKLATIERDRFADSKLSEVDELYRKYYVNEIDEEELVDGLIAGYIYGAGDVYGSYMSREEFEDYNNSLNSKTKGIGASVIWNSEMSAIEVIYVYENSPAEEAGIQNGDLIVEVDGVKVEDLGFDAGVNAVKGEEGTRVKLIIKRGEDYSQTLQIESERREIQIKTVSYEQYDKVAVISISNFYAATPIELKSAISSASSDGCDRIVFDLRNNSGGYLNSVLSVLDYILPEGVLVRTRDASNNWTEFKSDASCLQIPMVVLVNYNTASAAEPFTAALKDYDYATVIGTQTFGKGTVLEPFTLSDGSVVYISAELYYPPKSDNFEGIGITPDEIVELDETAQEIGYYKLTYETDNQLQRAVEIIKEK